MMSGPAARGAAPAYIPPFRALALFGRRLQERADRVGIPASKSPHERRPHVLADPTTAGIAAWIVSRGVAIGESWIAVVATLMCIVAAAIVRGGNSGAGQRARREIPSTMPAVPPGPAGVPPAEAHLDQVIFLRHRLGSCG